MKALSLKQPYAELILQGRKTIELRTWNTQFRGIFLIHASQTPDQAAMQRFGFTDLPRGCIVGKATLTDVKHYTTPKAHAHDNHKHLASTDWGSHGFLLRDVKRFKTPLPAKGKLNFWDYNEPIPE